MKLEDCIEPKERLQQGIFFTKPEIVTEIANNFDFNNISTVIDSAAGSCNFLIPFALEYPDIQFYGIEKNPFIFNEISREISNIHNIKYFLGDALLDEFPIPKCDLYLGNPPFINFSDLDPEYREEIKPIWLDYFPGSRGFKMLLGESRGDIAQLIFYFTIKKYLKEDGDFGVILPNSLIMGNNASSGFRDFNSITCKRIIDISHRKPFDNTSRNCFYILGKKGGTTSFPLNYETLNGNKFLIKIGSDLVENKNSILKDSPYTARQGINSLGANSIFFFKNKPPFYSELIRPLLKSSDINPFSCNPSYYALLPYKDGKLLTEDELQQNFPNEYKYLISNKSELLNRKSRFAQKNWFGLFGVGDYTFLKYKVIWRGLGAKEMIAAVGQDIIPNQAMNCYISTNNQKEAHYICGVMNSSIYKSQLRLLNESGAKSFAQPTTINKIYIPLFIDSKTQNKISAFSIKAHEDPLGIDFSILEENVRELYIKNGFVLDL